MFVRKHTSCYTLKINEPREGAAGFTFISNNTFVFCLKQGTTSGQGAPECFSCGVHSTSETV